MNNKIKKAWSNLKETAELFSLTVNQSELMTLKEACRYANESIFKISADKWKQPLCGFSSITRNGRPFWRENEVLEWTTAIKSQDSLVNYYKNILNNSQDSNISQGVLSGIISQIVEKKLPDYLIEVTDSFIRVKEMISA